MPEIVGRVVPGTAVTRRAPTDTTWSLDAPTAVNEPDQERPPISLEVTTSHQYLQCGAGKQALHALISVQRAVSGPPQRLPLNLCLLIDRSTSMKGDRLSQVKEATRQIIDNLEPADRLCLIAFNDRPQVVVPGGSGVDRSLFKALVGTVQAAGGTEIFQGLLEAKQQIENGRGAGFLDHLLLLTDGHTYGDDRNCLEMARWAADNDISITTVGVGTDWNEDLLDALATTTGGVSHFVADVADIQKVFGDTLARLRRMTVAGVRLSVFSAPGVRLAQLYQVSPVLAHLPTTSSSIEVNLGAVGEQETPAILVEFHISSPQVGPASVAQISAEARSHTNVGRPQVATHRLATEFADDAHAANPPVPPLIMSTMRRLMLLRLQEKVASDVADGNTASASRRLGALAAQYQRIGLGELAEIAEKQVDHLGNTGRLSKEGSKQLRYGTRALSSTVLKEFGQ